MDLALSEYKTPGIEALGGFMLAIERARFGMEAEEWRQFARKSPLVRRWRYFLTVDPYTRWGLVKPRGYAGDATLMDFAYGHASIRHDIDSAGTLGEQVYRYTSGAPQSASARLRIALVTAEIEKRATQQAPATVISFAAGHARELENVSEAARNGLGNFIAIDTDPQSLQMVASSGRGINVQAERRNVITADLSDLPTACLTYSLGLFDYLDEEHAVAVLSKMLALTQTGGVTIVANLAPNAANLAYCEAIMDWWMIPRSEEDLMRLADQSLVAAPGVDKVSVSRHGCFSYLRIVKEEV